MPLNATFLNLGDSIIIWRGAVNAESSHLFVPLPVAPGWLNSLSY